MTATRHR